MASIDTEIKDIEEEIARKIQLVNELKAMKTIYPDLERVKGRWDKIAFCSASVNNKVTNYETRYNCGCCSDSPLEVWLYAEIEGNKKIYSNPPFFFVGKRNNWGSNDPIPGWSDTLRKANIAESMIKTIGGFVIMDDKEEKNEV
jgi:hypothetical protein